MKTIFRSRLHPLFLAFAIANPAIPVAYAQADTTINPIAIVAEGKSAYNIVIPVGAPVSVQNAAQEIQRCVAIATGVSLSLVQDDAMVTGPVISIGATVQADAAGITTEGIAEEGFRIVTKDGNVFIIGPDLPNEARTKNGGISNGSANGVYTFLENYLGVRWLLPGDLGRDVPTKSTFSVGAIDVKDAPYFINRRLPYTALDGKVQPAISLWHQHQKQGYSFRVEHSHNWEKVIPRAMHQEHPDWFPMIDGQRPLPQGQFYKLETTNPEVIQRFADQAVAALKANPQVNMFSLSPSDGFGWSQSPESLPFYDKNPDGGQSMTPLVLKFYSDVAKAVAAKMPDAKLGGYIYNDYLYPPSSGDLKLPDNFYPVLAGSISYGFRLYREPVQAKFTKLLQDWSKVTPHLFYYDLPNTFGPWTKGQGTIVPATPGLQNFIFKTLVENNVKGLYIYGNVDWGYGALSNYMWTRQMWNPKLDAYDIQKEWLQRAYGNDAGAVMNELYLKLDDWFKEYYQKTPGASGHYTNVMLKDLYGVRYPAIEELILKAKSKPMTAPQKQRFQLIENNIIALQWRLRLIKALPADYQSELTRTAEQIMAMIAEKQPDFEVFPNFIGKDGRP